MELSAPTLETRTEARHLLALALLAFAVVVLELAITRLLSVILWYHWAFFSLTLAMLGLGVPGVWIAVFQPQRSWLTRCLELSTVAVAVGAVLVIQLTRWFAPFSILFVLTCLLPAFLALGAATCLLLFERGRPGFARRYGADLFGACAGAVLAGPLMDVIPTPSLIGLLAGVPLVARLLVDTVEARRVLLIAGPLGLALVWGEPFTLRSTKAYDEQWVGFTPILERWTSTARLTVFDSVFWARPQERFGWGFGRTPPGEPPRQYWVEQDGAAGTPITEFDGDLRRLEWLLDDVTNLAYGIRPLRRVAVIGAGGGRDVLAALAAGCEQVDAIEMNPALLDLVRGPFGALAGGLYERADVNAVIGEGRSVLARSPGDYDLILISLVDSWAATNAGAFALSENHLYTLEAYRLYWSKLSPEGIISTSRWMVGGFAPELPRLLTLARAALLAEGVDAPERHLVLAQGGAVGTLLASRSPFSGGELRALRESAAKRGLLLRWPEPAVPAPPPRVGDVPWTPADVLAGRTMEFARAGLRIDPPTDDRPFFFQVATPLTPVRASTMAGLGVNGAAVQALRMLLGVCALVAGLLFFAPFALRRRLPRPEGFWLASTYFAAIGAGFMLLETSVVQRLVLPLEHPTRALAAALGGMLFGAGAGTLLARRIPSRLVFPLLGAAAALVLAGSSGLEALTGSLATHGLSARIATATLFAAAVALPLGTCFPLGLSRFGHVSPPWLWAVNGCAGVLASVSSLALAMELGFSGVTELAAVCYGIAAAAMLPRWSSAAANG